MKKIFLYLTILLFISCFSAEKSTKSQLETNNSKNSVIESFEDLKSNKINDQNYLEKNEAKKDNGYLSEPKLLMSKNENLSEPIIVDNFNYVEKHPKYNIPKKDGKFSDLEIKEGKLIYSIPDTMKLGNTYTLRIRINRDINHLKLTDTLYKQQVINIKTTSSMEVIVIDPSTEDSKSFSILKQNSDKQLIDDSDYTEWVYSVKPLKSGKLKLNIIISIIKNDNKKEIVYFNSVYVKSDNVVVVETFWEKYWQWIMSTIIIPFIIFIYKKRKNKED